MMWHQILSHMGEKSPRAILNKKLVHDLSNYSIRKNDLYEHCVFGKKMDHHFLKEF